MLNLILTTDKLQLVTDSAATVDVHASGAEVSDSTFATNGLYKQNTAISSATTTDIVASPASGKIRNIKTLHIRNKSTSQGVTVTVLFNANATTYELFKVLLNTGDQLEYVEGIGFFVVLGAASKLNVVKYVTADSVHATAATFADITGLTQDLKSGKNYIVEAHLFHTSNATTTGAQFGYNIGAAPTLAIFGNYSGVTNSVTGGAMALGTATARDTAITAQTTGSQPGVTHTIVGGYLKPSADGTFALRATSEVSVASGLTVKQGSWMLIRETDN